jgi:hypothetical protein
MEPIRRKRFQQWACVVDAIKDTRRYKKIMLGFLAMSDLPPSPPQPDFKPGFGLGFLTMPDFPPSPPQPDSKPSSRRGDPTTWIIDVLLWGAGAFLFASLLCLGYFLYVLIKIGIPSVGQFRDVREQVLAVLPALDVPILLLVTTLIAALIGVALIRAARYSIREVIPLRDRDLLTKLIVGEKVKGIDQYIRLSSLTGTTGVFTRLGLVGLPLATIGLTIFFTLLAPFNTSFLDLAKLTLGAFIGSYVQKQASETSVMSHASGSAKSGIRTDTQKPAPAPPSLPRSGNQV